MKLSDIWKRIRRFLYNNSVVKSLLKRFLRDFSVEMLEDAVKQKYIDEALKNVITLHLLESGHIDQFVESKWGEYIVKPEEEEKE